GYFMLIFSSTPPVSMSPTPQQIADLRLAASQMTGATRRAFQAEMTLKYCDGNARRAEDIFGWGRQNIEVGLAEKRTGIVCLSLHAAFSGRQRWEDQYPEAAEALVELAFAHSQQDPTFRTPVSYTRLTAKTATPDQHQRLKAIAALSGMTIVVRDDHQRVCVRTGVTARARAG